MTEVILFQGHEVLRRLWWGFSGAMVGLVIACLILTVEWIVRGTIFIDYPYDGYMRFSIAAIGMGFALGVLTAWHNIDCNQCNPPSFGD